MLSSDNLGQNKMRRLSPIPPQSNDEGAKEQKTRHFGIIEMGGGVAQISHLFCPRLWVPLDNNFKSDFNITDVNKKWYIFNTNTKSMTKLFAESDESVPQRLSGQNMLTCSLCRVYGLYGKHLTTKINQQCTKLLTCSFPLSSLSFRSFT